MEPAARGGRCLGVTHPEKLPITPEMIRAGEIVLASRGELPIKELLEEIYRAMVAKLPRPSDG